MPRPITLNTHYYQQFDADLSRDVSAEGYGGWKQTKLTFDLTCTALVVMHAWDCGTPEQFPGWYRCVEYIPRANKIASEVFPPILKAARAAKMTLYHVVGGGDVYKKMPGFRRAQSLAAPRHSPERVDVADPFMDKISEFRGDNVFVGKQNREDVNAGFEDLQFMPQAVPMGDEGIAEHDDHLHALAKADGINHLIYIGFAINWCLLKSPGGMVDMSRRGYTCSTIRQATTAVENAESARFEMAKHLALWRVALAFGFVFDDHEVIRTLDGMR
ncbi:MAG: hypothetical protein K8S99_10725 [Planctomycetes bacterium]|nr:hypothetical protein [Planctomycetota bacterium]